MAVKETKECPICNLSHISFFSKKDEYVFLKCDDCKLVFMNPLPDTKELIANFYSEESGYHHKLVENLKKIKKYDKNFIKIIDKLADFGIKGNLLDVGCANGEFLFLAKKYGFNVYGVEANAYTAGIAASNKLNVFNGFLEDANFKNNYFSVIYLGDIIEHVVDPLALLSECKRILKKGGIIVISTPNIDCFWFKATRFICHSLKMPWSVLIPPYHLYLFSEDNFKRFMHKLDFKTLEVEYGNVSLRHELGGTWLLPKLKKEKSIQMLLYTISVFSIYTVVYAASFLLKPFFKKDFEMIVFAENQ
ncbi:MAG: class I SAM-dependent methyltransferase [Candidatus Staskawiczbacteria bacterium]|nr:class I SAM-dependent methyltransferase [Candidatus Staskawiczbacteria bacterium]MBI3337264.1 class I SAM-dependent methyltransferase [Candidatus Staskawiczbacteria bacterium]